MSPKTLYNVKTCGMLVLLLVPLYPIIAITVMSRIFGRAFTLTGCWLIQAGVHCRRVPESAAPKIPGAKRYAGWVYKKVDSVKKPVDS